MFKALLGFMGHAMTNGESINTKTHYGLINNYKIYNFNSIYLFT